MLVAKQVADLVTFTRLLIAFYFAWLGLVQGQEGLPLAVWLLLLDWTGDLLDGRIARRSRRMYHTWIGDHDLQVDMVVAIGLLVYLVFARWVDAWLGLAYLVVWAILLYLTQLPRSLGMLFQAPIYGWFIWIAVRQVPSAGLWIIVWIITVVVVTWPMFPKQIVPGFINGLNLKRRRPASH